MQGNPPPEEKETTSNKSACSSVESLLRSIKEEGIMFEMSL